MSSTTPNVCRTPREGFYSVLLWRRVHNKVGPYLGPTRNGVADLGGDLERGDNEAVPTRGRGPDIHRYHLQYTIPGTYVLQQLYTW